MIVTQGVSENRVGTQKEDEAHCLKKKKIRKFLKERKKENCMKKLTNNLEKPRSGVV